MTGKTHKAISVTAGLLVLSSSKAQETLTGLSGTTNEAITAGTVFLAGCIFGGLLSDVDDKESTVGWWMYPLLRKFYNKPPREKGVAFYHRHITHSVWVILTFLLIWAICFPVAPALLTVFLFGVPLGVFSHIGADWIMSEVALLSPFTEKKFSLLHLKSEKAQKICDMIARWVSYSANVLLLVRGVMVWEM